MKTPIICATLIICGFLVPVFFAYLDTTGKVKHPAWFYLAGWITSYIGAAIMYTI